MSLKKRFEKQFSYGKLVTKCFVDTMLATKKWQFMEDYDGTVEDIIFKKDLRLWSVDLGRGVDWQVKGEKNVSRRGSILERVYQVLEFRVEDKYHNAHEGWLYGRYEAIAFYARDYFICIDRKNLLKFATERVLEEGSVLEKWPDLHEVECYRLYCRRHPMRIYDHPNERIMYVPLSDLLTIKHYKVGIPVEFNLPEV